MIKDIKYNGYTAQPSDYECPDGQLDASINLISEDSQLKPLLQPTPRSIGLTDSQKAVYIHHTAAGKYYIVYDRNAAKILWKNQTGGSISVLGNAYDFSHCNAVGNTLIVFTDNEMHYYLWSDMSYIDLGNRLPHVNVSFGLVGHPRLFSQSEPKFTVSFADGISEEDIHADFSENNKTKITEQIMAKLNRFIREQTVEKGRFCFPFFVRCALRLYDGSIVCHSAPVLMNPSTRPAPLVLWGRAHGQKNYTEAKDCDIMMVAANLDYLVLKNDDFSILDNWKDIIKSIDVFISKPIYTYDQNGKISNLTDTDNFQTSFIGRLYHDKYNRGGTSAYFPSSVTEDCMIGPITMNDSADFLSHYMEWPYSCIYQLYFTNADKRPYPGETFHLPEYNDGKNLENLANCATFYKLHSISLEDAKSSVRKVVPVEDDYLQSLLTREIMTDDYLSNDRLVASASQVYNSRINLSGIKRQLFGGFSPLSMFAFCDKQLGSYEVVGNTVSLSASAGYDSVSLTVYLKEGGQTFAVSASSDGIAPWGSGIYYTNADDEQTQENGKRRRKSWGAYLFYPNVNAFKMVVHSLYGADRNDNNPYGLAAIVIDLKPHDFLNGAFAILDYDSIRVHNYTPGAVPPLTASPNSLVDCGNKVYTSEVNNPFYFPLSGINTVGTGRIMAISTAAKALSQGQFGQFPLYAFTDEGVWALELSSTGSYSARQPITRDVILANTQPLQMDSAVLFATDRGIMLISGSQTQCITDVLNSNAPFDVLQLPGMAKLHTMLGHDADTCLPTAPFLEFIAECGMLYDYVHQRVIVYNPHYTYAYVYSLKSKQWGMMYSSIEAGINSYPEALAVDHDGALLNFSSMDAEPTNGLFVTRPLKLETPDVLKTIDTVIQRGRFRKGHLQSVLYGSRDLFNWHLIWSSKDHCLRGFRGTPYKYFRIACVTSLAHDESIFGASLQFNPRHTNQPR